MEFMGKESGLSNREIEILQHVASGDTTHEIARTLFISHHTVISHRKNLYTKLGARNAAHLVLIGVKAGVLSF